MVGTDGSTELRRRPYILSTSFLSFNIPLSLSNLLNVTLQLNAFNSFFNTFLLSIFFIPMRDQSVILIRRRRRRRLVLRLRVGISLSRRSNLLMPFSPCRLPTQKRHFCDRVYLLGAQCDQIGQFIGLWATFQSLWQQLICPNLPRSETFLVKVSKSFIFLVKSFLGNFYRHSAFFSGHTVGALPSCLPAYFYHYRP